jgi:hypothetical protein
LREEHFIYFFVVFGFFVGLVLGVVNAHSAFMLVMYPVGITLFFYLAIHVIISSYVDFKKPVHTLFDRDIYEMACDEAIDQIDKKEHIINSHLEFVLKKNRGTINATKAKA